MKKRDGLKPERNDGHVQSGFRVMQFRSRSLSALKILAEIVSTMYEEFHAGYSHCASP